MNTFTFVLTEQELNVVFNALREKPYKEAAPVIDSIVMQINAANAEKEKQMQEETKVEDEKEGDKE